MRMGTDAGPLTAAWQAPRRSVIWEAGERLFAPPREAAARTAGRLDLMVDGVTVAYPNGHVALRDASLHLDGPTICGLLGVNGAGKSTLFKAVMGMVRPAAGTVRIAGGTVEMAQKRNWVAYVPQSEEVDWAFPVSVRDVVMMGRYGYMGRMRLPRAIDRAAVEAALRRVGMLGFADRQIGQLSGGQKKRVFLARALAQDGRLILLDEPFGGVDVTTQEQLIGLLRELRDEGRIILVSTHDLASVPGFCDQVAFVKGTVVAAGRTDEVFTASNLAATFGDSLSMRALAGAVSGEAAMLVPGKNGETLVLASSGQVVGRLAAAD